jgi:hypothetical protein
MASIQLLGVGGASNLVGNGLKLLLVDKFGLRRSTGRLITGASAAGGRLRLPCCRFYSTPATSTVRASGQTPLGVPVGMFDPSLYRLPLKTPPVINQRLIINYDTPPRSSPSEILDHPPLLDKIIEAPNSPSTFVKKQAKGRPGLIVIRRIKMNRHKLKKRRRKLKYLLLKIITRRETRKEKEFCDSLMAKVRAADKFDAKAFVANAISKAKEKPPVVMWWMRNKLPDWLVKEKLAEEAAAERRAYLSILDKRDQGKIGVKEEEKKVHYKFYYRRFTS